MNVRLTHLDLFSGIGGFALAAQWNGLETIAFSEVDPYASAVLKKHWPNVPNLGDIRNVTREALAIAIGAWELQQEGGVSEGRRRTRDRCLQSRELRRIYDELLKGNKPCCDLLTGGFPCQPFSVAGKRGGASDDRALWPEMFRVITEVAPAWVLAENVPGIINMELDRVLFDLERIGYTCLPPLVIPACAVDAKHRRDRVWIVAYANSPGWRERRRAEPVRKEQPAIKCHRQTLRTQWEPEPDVGRVAYGISRRVDRLKGLGNAIVPQVAAEIMRMMFASKCEAP